jgi:DNA-binding transcriptional MerR regulator
MHTVKELKDLIRKHKKAECPPMKGMKKADMLAYAKKVGALPADHEEKPVEVAEAGAKTKRPLTEYQKLVKEQRKLGLSMKEIGAMYKAQKAGKADVPSSAPASAPAPERITMKLKKKVKAKAPKVAEKKARKPRVKAPSLTDEQIVQALSDRKLAEEDKKKAEVVEGPMFRKQQKKKD